MILDYGTAVDIRLKNMKPDYTGGYREHTHDIGLALSGFNLRRAHVKKTRVPEEWKNKITEAAVTARQTLATKRAATLDKLKDMIAEERRTADAHIAAGATKEDPVLKYLRQREVRDHLRSLDPIMLPMTIGKAIEAGDLDFINAIREAPRMFPAVPKELLQDMNDQVVARVNPKIVELEQVADAYQFAFNVADEHIAAALREEGLPGTDELIVLQSDSRQ